MENGFLIHSSNNIAKILCIVIPVLQGHAKLIHRKYGYLYPYLEIFFLSVLVFYFTLFYVFMS